MHPIWITLRDALRSEDFTTIKDILDEAILEDWGILRPLKVEETFETYPAQKVYPCGNAITVEKPLFVRTELKMHDPFGLRVLHSASKRFIDDYDRDEKRTREQVMLHITRRALLELEAPLLERAEVKRVGSKRAGEAGGGE